MIARILIFGFVTVLVACNQSDKSVDKKNETEQIAVNSTLTANNDIGADNKIVKSIKLANGFVVNLGKAYDYETYITYSFFNLSNSERVIFTDSLHEYEFGKKMYPIVLQTERNKYELIFEVNNIPNKNYLLRLFVQNDRLVRTDTLPTFITQAYDLNGDGIDEYAGYWHYSEIWGNNNDSAAYNPILFFRVASNGLVLDSALTIKRNKIIYGDFYGFYYNENHAVAVEKSKLFTKEVELIEKRR